MGCDLRWRCTADKNPRCSIGWEGCDIFKFWKCGLTETNEWRASSGQKNGCMVGLPDMIDRLSCPAKEKDYESESPLLSNALKGTAKEDAKALRRAVSMIVALCR